MKISMIVPVYNTNHSWLKQCIESLVSQKYEKEIIVIDDGSKQNVSELCTSIGEKYSDVTVIHKANQGVSCARNTGIDYANGKYIMFIDSDDYLDESTLSNISLNKEINDDLIAFNVNIFKDNTLFPQENFCNDNIIDNYTAQQAVLDNENKYNAWFLNTVWGKIYNLNIIKDNNLRFNSELKRMEDIVFNLNYLKYVDFVRYIPVDGYCYRISDTSLVRKFDSNYNDVLQNAFKALHEFKNNNINLSNKIYYKTIMMVVDFIINKIFSNKNTMSLKNRKYEFVKICNCTQVIESVSNFTIDNKRYFSLYKHVLFIKHKCFWPYLMINFIKRNNEED